MEAPLPSSLPINGEDQHDEFFWSDDDEDADVCKICRCPGDADAPLYHPCQCKGSIKYVHRECLMSWMNHSGKRACELCSHNYSFKSVYHQDAPAVLPKFELLQHAFSKATSSIYSSIRDVCAMFVWLFLFPIFTSFVWRFYFSNERWALSILPVLRLDYTWGAFLSIAISGSCIIVFTIYEYFSFHLGGGRWVEDGEEIHGDDDEEEDGNDVMVDDHPEGDERILHGDDDGDGDEGEDGEVRGGDGAVRGGDGAVRGGDGAMMGLFDDGNGEEEEEEGELFEDGAGFEELTGWNGPFSQLFMKMLKMVVFNALVLFVFVLAPTTLGRIALEFMRTSFDSPLFPRVLSEKINAHIVRDGAYSPTFYLSVLEFIFGGKLDVHIMIHCAGGYGIVLSMALGWVAANRALGLHVRPVASASVYTFLTRQLWIMYIAVKVAVLLVVELGIFPLMSGWWLDICTLSMYGSTFQARKAFFNDNPISSCVMHWVIGMIYQYWFATVVGWTLEVVRPSVLWFLRAPTDPDFQPIRELATRSIPRHIRRVALSAGLYGAIVALTLWVPIALCLYTFPSLFPLRSWFTMPIYDGPIGLLVHIAAPITLEHIKPHVAFKRALSAWLHGVGTALGLQGYLFHRYDETTGVELPAEKPKQFIIRMVSLYTLALLSTIVFNVGVVAIPLCAGRMFFAAISLPDVNDLCTFGVGFYLVWDGVRVTRAMMRYIMEEDVMRVCRAIAQGVVKYGKVGFVAFFWLGVIPLLIGLLIELSIVAPLRTSYDQTPLRSPWYQDWAAGLVYLKLWCKVVSLSPNSKWKVAFDKIKRDGIARLDVIFVLSRVIAPFMHVLFLALSIPYITARALLPMVITSTLAASRTYHLIYTLFLMAFCCIAMVKATRDAFNEWHNRVRDERYLIGQDIVNVDDDEDEDDGIALLMDHHQEDEPSQEETLEEYLPQDHQEEVGWTSESSVTDFDEW